MSNGWRTPIGLAAAVIAVALGLSAALAKNSPSNLVLGLVVRGGQTHTSASPARTPSPQATTQTFELVGGTVTVTCANGVITVNDATPKTGFTVQQELKDEGMEAEIRFESATHESRIEVECLGNQVQVEELREEAVQAPAPPVQPTPGPPQSMTRTFNLVGGTVTVTCMGNTLTVNSAMPNPGFSMEQERKDNNMVAEFRFENDAHRSRLEVGCAAGQVMVEELREESR